ncbi:MAG: hypothetical protein Q9O74_03100 [Planctomycetota bacterium]|nr:hypothetical protein [Planctomycetota bacterium]
MARTPQPRLGRPRSSTSRRFAMYFLGVAMGLILVGLLSQMRQIMVPPPPTPAGGESTTGPNP